MYIRCVDILSRNSQVLAIEMKTHKKIHKWYMNYIIRKIGSWKNWNPTNKYIYMFGFLVPSSKLVETWYTMSGFKLNSVVFLAATIFVIVLQLVPPSSQLLLKKFNKLKFGGNIDPSTGIKWIELIRDGFFFSWNQFYENLCENHFTKKNHYISYWFLL